MMVGSPRIKSAITEPVAGLLLLAPEMPADHQPDRGGDDYGSPHEVTHWGGSPGQGRGVGMRGREQH